MIQLFMTVCIVYCSLICNNGDKLPKDWQVLQDSCKFVLFSKPLYAFMLPRLQTTVTLCLFFQRTFVDCIQTWGYTTAFVKWCKGTHRLVEATSPRSTARRNFFSSSDSCAISWWGRITFSSSIIPWMLCLCKGQT